MAPGLGRVFFTSLFTLLPTALVAPAGAQQPARPTASARTAAAKVTSAGTFSDSTGAKHSWQVNGAHALIWDGAPYLPVGGRFTPRSFASDAAWEADVKALTTLKSKGVRDLIVWPEKSLLDVPPTSLKRLLDYLDANDFRYGLSFGAGLTAPLTGTIVKPSSYRFADTKDALTATWQVPDTDKGLFVLTDTNEDNKIVRIADGVPARDNLISVPLDTPASAGRVVALLYPHKALPAQGESALPDLWNAFDGYRDRALALLEPIKFGKGLRFFLDPLARHIGLAGETDYLIPDSDEFRMEWEGYLTHQYPNLEDAKQAWGLAEGEFKTQHELAQLLPLWANGRGVPYCYSLADHRTYRILDVNRSQWWQDFLQCRNESILYTMNALADLLKRQVADVPVVYTWTQLHPIFRNTERSGGYDGLSVPVRLRGSALVARTLGPAYSEAEQSERTIWYLATEIASPAEIRSQQPAAGAHATIAAVATNGASSAPPTGGGGYISSADLAHDMDSLRRIGVKGFFAGAFQPSANTTDWMAAPDSLDWLHEYAARVEGDTSLARYTPRVLFYPQASPGPAHVGLVPGTSDVLWLNSFYSGEALDWWPAYSGYSVRRSEDTPIETVLVSLQGRRQTHLWTLNPKAVQAYTPEGLPVPIKIVGTSTLLVTLDTTPTVFKTGDQKLIPQEAAEDILTQLAALLRIATAQKVPAADAARAPLDRATAAYHQKNFEEAYVFAHGALDDLMFYTAPYIWVEGEVSRYHTFTDVASNPEASNGAYLRLSTPNPPSRLGYGVRYLFDVVNDGRYNIWLAGTIPGTGASPIKWRINSDPDQEVADPTPRGPLYLGDRFGWILLGTANLKRGAGQSLSIYVTDRALATQDYTFGIDALLLTPRAFVPNGTVRPLPVDFDTLHSRAKDKRENGKSPSDDVNPPG